MGLDFLGVVSIACNGNQPFSRPVIVQGKKMNLRDLAQFCDTLMKKDPDAYTRGLLLRELLFFRGWKSFTNDGAVFDFEMADFCGESQVNRLILSGYRHHMPLFTIPSNANKHFEPAVDSVHLVLNNPKYIDWLISQFDAQYTVKRRDVNKLRDTHQLILTFFYGLVLQSWLTVSESLCSHYSKSKTQPGISENLVEQTTHHGCIQFYYVSSVTCIETVGGKSIELR